MASYNLSDPASIEEFSQQLYGHSVAELTAQKISGLTHAHTKGKLGQYLERYFYGITPPSDDNHLPDFERAGLELKTAGVKKVRKRGEFVYVSKERISLTMINYMSIVDEVWESCSLMQKCQLILFVFHLYDKNTDPLDRKTVLPPFIWKFPAEDLRIIAEDWNKIVGKIKKGKGHELSEGDTFYLGACTKGASSVPKQKQPYSDELCKTRAFSLKKSYVDTIIAAKGYSQLADSALEDVARPKDIESIVMNKLARFIGMTPEEISDKTGFIVKKPVPKHVLRLLANRMLDVHTDEVLEFQKAGVTIKTVRLQRNGKPKEGMSFAGFKAKVIAEQSWEDSKFNKELEKGKFLLVIFQFDNNGILKFKGGKFWNMPYNDRLEARKVWEEARYRLINDQVNQLPTKTRYENGVAHVRPKGRNKKDVDYTPSGKAYPKKCFWLNASYIGSIIGRTADTA